MNLNNISTGPSFLPNKKPKKLIFMLHGYGDSGDNFIHLAKTLDKLEWEANYIALNAPAIISNNPIGRQWFNLYPNGVYIADAGKNEMEIIKTEILESVKYIEKIINETKNNYGLSYSDCFVLGFSQGGMMAFEVGKYFDESFAGLAILSGRVIFEEIIINPALLQTPIFISHGNKDDVLPINVFNTSCNYLLKNKITLDSQILDGDTHTISAEAISLLQKFIKKTMV